MKPKLLDLFCGAGGCSRGYDLAGFDIVGVDKWEQPHYPYEFHRANALDFPLTGFDAIHASPPCQYNSYTWPLQYLRYEDVIGEIRDRLKNAGIPYIIENVKGSELIEPAILCGSMFDLGVYRHRLFETSFPLRELPWHPIHDRPQTPMGRVPVEGEMMHVVGNFSGVKFARKAMGIDWMTRPELAQAIPPAYTQFIGTQLMLSIAANNA